jgi:hypothetical protein
VRFVDDDVDGLVEALQGSLKHQIMKTLRVETTESRTMKLRPSDVIIDTVSVAELRISSRMRFRISNKDTVDESVES